MKELATKGQKLLASAACACWCGLTLPTEIAASPRYLYERYTGTLTWLLDGSSQNFHLIIAEERIDEAGNSLLARGWERYEVGDRCLSVAIELTVDLRSRAFILQRLPVPSDLAQETTVGDPIVGVMSRDFGSGLNDLAISPDDIVDVAFRAVPKAKDLPRYATSAALHGC